MKGNSVTGTPYTTIRQRPNLAVSVDKTPERAEEDSFAKGTSIPREHPSVDERRATSFRREKRRDAEDRIGVPVRKPAD